MPIDSINPDVKQLEDDLAKLGVDLSDYTPVLNQPSKMVLTFSEHLTRQVYKSLQKDGLGYYLTKADLMSKGNSLVPSFTPETKAKILSVEPVYKIHIQGALRSVYIFVLSLIHTHA